MIGHNLFGVWSVGWCNSHTTPAPQPDNIKYQTVSQQKMNEPDRKRPRPEPPDANDVLRIARRIWGRDGRRQRSPETEDLEFRSFFGCSVAVFLSLWSLLGTTDTIPTGGTMTHLLWTLLFLKVYSNAKSLCALVGGVDPETFRKWTWLFIPAIANLEPLVVSGAPTLRK